MTVKMEVLLELEIDPQGLTSDELKSHIHRGVRYAMGDGTFTRGTDATIEGWDCTVDFIQGDADANLSPEELEAKYSPKGDGEHPSWPRIAWVHEVGRGDTVTGYWAWVSHNLKGG